MFSGVGKHPVLKLLCLAGLGLWIALWYYPPQQWPLFEARPAPALWFDDWVPFQPGWALIYQSVFFTHLAAIWLPGDHRAVRRYTFVLGAVYTVAAFVFWFYPTLSPRPAEVESRLYYWLVTAVDGERNAVPSLHAAMGTLAALQLDWHVRAIRARPVWRILIGGWWCVFLYSTLATRQHRVLDLVAGVLLAVLLQLLARRYFQSLVPAETARVG
jgi:hypothetical protein